MEAKDKILMTEFVKGIQIEVADEVEAEEEAKSSVRYVIDQVMLQLSAIIALTSLFKGINSLLISVVVITMEISNKTHTRPYMNQIDASTPSLRDDDQNWYVDSRATNHVTVNLQNLSFQQDYKGKGKLIVGNGSQLNISHIGDIFLHSSHPKKTTNFTQHTSCP